MLRVLVMLAAFVAFSSAAEEYRPTIYPLRDGLVPALNIAGNIDISNAETSKESVVVYKYGFLKLESNYHDITQTFIDQLKIELAKNGKQLPGGTAKKLDLKVTSLVSNYKVFHWKSSLSMQATLDDGTTVYIDVNHASGGVYQDLNGCIAEGVLKFLKDETIRAYLSRTDATPAAQ